MSRISVGRKISILTLFFFLHLKTWVSGYVLPSQRKTSRAFIKSSSSFTNIRDPIRNYVSGNHKPYKLSSFFRQYYVEGINHEFEDIPMSALEEIEENKAKYMLENMQRWKVPVSSSVSKDGSIEVTGVFFPKQCKGQDKQQLDQENMNSKTGNMFDFNTITNLFNGGSIQNRKWQSESFSAKPPVLCLHGFDSSCLEYRRLAPLLSKELDTFCIDVLGWGFSQLKDVENFSVESKREYLYAFWKTIMKEKKMVLCGASLGGAIAIDFAYHYPEAVEKLILIDGQAYIDGVGSMSKLPKPLAKLGISVLKSPALRAYAGKLSYYRSEIFSTEDAMRIGRIHTLRDGWDDATLSYMSSGGYFASKLVKELNETSLKILVLWGEQDQILDPKLYVKRFEEDLPTAEISMVDECGHVMHLEKPEITAEQILKFV